MIRPKLTSTLLTEPDYETDLLIIGGGGAGCWAAITAARKGMKSLIATKLRMGDANTMMSEGGMQAAVSRTDSPTRHYLDAMGGGHFDNDPALVRVLTEDAPEVVRELENLGVMWDKMPDGSMQVLHGGGTSRKRMVSCRDYIGAIIMRTLMDEVRNHPDMISVREFEPAVELLLDEHGKCAGAILYSLDTEQFLTVKAKATIIATGGFGRLHIRGFATTNHYGATGDGLVIAYRAGAKLKYMDSVQYHPTGAVFPEQIAGFLITEKIRGAGGQPLNKHGELFVFPREPRDVESAAIIRECSPDRNNGIDTWVGRTGVWLDSPIIEEIYGEGYIHKQFPGMCRQFDPLRHRHREGADADLSVAALSEWRRRHQRALRDQHSGPLCGGRGVWRRTRAQPPHGQLGARLQRVWPARRAIRHRICADGDAGAAQPGARRRPRA